MTVKMFLVNKLEYKCRASILNKNRSGHSMTPAVFKGNYRKRAQHVFDTNSLGSDKKLLQNRSRPNLSNVSQERRRLNYLQCRLYGNLDISLRPSRCGLVHQWQQSARCKPLKEFSPVQAVETCFQPVEGSRLIRAATSMT